MYFWQNDSGKTQRYIETITPAIAQESIDNLDARLAELGLVARPVNQARVRQYALSIQRGEWQAFVQPIHLAKNGAVLNGMHRLLAVILAGMSVTVDVVKNAPVEYYTLFDTGHRSIRDGLAIEQANYDKVKSSLIPLVWAFHEGKVGSYRIDEVPQTVVSEINDECGKELDTAIEFAKDSEYKANYVAFLYYILRRANLLNKDTRGFLEQFKDGVGVVKHSPAYKLRRLIHRHGRNIRNKELLAKMFYVINNIIDGSHIGILRSDWSYHLSDGLKMPKLKKKAAAAGATKK